MSRLLCNLQFLEHSRFKPFEIAGYRFEPIPQKLPITRNRAHNLNTCNMHITARVTLPSRQRDSVLFRGGRLDDRWKRKFIEDILILMSILISRKVVLRCHRVYRFFPTWAGLHCEEVARDSASLRDYLAVAIPEILGRDWQRRFVDGFHVRTFYNFSDITNAEARYLADITIWEFLYYCENKTILTYDQLVRKSLNAKLNFLLKTYLIPSHKKIRHNQLDVFVHLRNQLSHNGKLPIENPKSRFRTLNWNGCKAYMDLFKRLTQALVLKTLNIDARKTLGMTELKELLAKGEVHNYH